ncbi:PAB-dependent poly(A)-specific ribonuclease subunit 3 [Chytriomyces hyalinus]|nr:PAB-dependent poly(A)-specific ribonuclease subunit 3 [Chytriomyces hyalinus]
MGPPRCRNIATYGYCKYERSGCEFSHAPDDAQATASTSGTQYFNPQDTPDRNRQKLRYDSPEFKPSNISHGVLNAPSFVPSNLASHVGFNSFEAFDSPEPAYAGYEQRHNQYEHDQMVSGFASMGVSNSNPPVHERMTSGSSFFQNLDGMDSFSSYQDTAPLQTASNPLLPLQYHLYNPPLPHVSNMGPQQKPIHYFFMDENLRETLQRRSEAAQQLLDPNAPEAANLPSEVHVYHSLSPIDDKPERHSKVFGFPTCIYKAISALDGKPYVLRRIEGFRLLTDAAISSVEPWRRLKHSSIVSVREAFTTKAFGDNSLIFVYDYHPLSTTLSAKYLSATPLRANAKPGVPERSLWSYIVQISSAIKALHSAGLAARILEPSKILVTGKNRVRLNCCGIFDTINFDGGKSMLQFQQDDLVNFGRLIVALACGALASVHNLPKSLEHISRSYSPDLKNVILLLLSKRNSYKSIDEVLTMIMPRVVHEMSTAHGQSDILESELTRETENGRVVRLLCKLGFINERPEFDLDPSWSETGDRYLLKLFRDYVFHQVDELGNPVVDVGHVLQCLNKLDAGVDEKIMLMSRDEQSCLIVSYKDLKQCVDTSFGHLSRTL